MLLYHCFPRGATDRFGQLRSNQIGVEQIETIKKYGLLLTPELFSIPENQLAAKHEGESPKVEFFQARACFTLAEREELLMARDPDNMSHFELFGDFAIGLKPADARKLGSVPVFYMYDAFGGCPEISHGVNLSREILFNLRELRSVMIALARLEAKAEIPGRDTLDVAMLDRIGYVLQGDPIVRRRIDRVNHQKAREAVDLLDTDRGPAWSLVDLIDITLNLFQTADSKDSDGLRQHAYYQQREWRIVQLFNPFLRCQRLGSGFELDGIAAMTPDERRDLRKRLTELNPGFFNESRLENSAILRGTSDRDDAKATDFFEFVEEIICPSAVASYVKELDERDEFEQSPINEKKQVVFERRARR